MKKNLRRLQAAVVLAVLCAALLVLPAAATQSQIDEANEEIKALEESREGSLGELKDLKNQKSYLDSRQQELDEELTGLARELTDLQSRLSETEENLVLTQQELAEARLQEEQQYEAMKKRIQFLYERGETSFLEVLVEARSFADFINFSNYVETIHLYDRRMLEEYRSLKEDIAAKEQFLEAEQQELAVLTGQQEEAIAKVEELLAQVEQEIGNMNAQIAAAQEEIAAYDAALEKQRAYEEELERQKAEEDARRQEEIRRQEEELRQQQEENRTPPAVSDSASDLAILAALIECEAGGESYEGKLAVGSVVMNRVSSSYFPNSVVGVIYQSGQFSPVASGRFATVLSRGANSSCIQAAQEVLSGTRAVDCLYFCRNTGTISGTVIGNHVFY